MIGAYTGDLNKVVETEKIYADKGNAISCWDIDVVEAIKRDENVVDVFMLSEMNNDLRLIFQSD